MNNLQAWQVPVELKSPDLQRIPGTSLCIAPRLKPSLQQLSFDALRTLSQKFARPLPLLEQTRERLVENSYSFFTSTRDYLSFIRHTDPFESKEESALLADLWEHQGILSEPVLVERHTRPVLEKAIRRPMEYAHLFRLTPNGERTTYLYVPPEILFYVRFPKALKSKLSEGLKTYPEEALRAMAEYHHLETHQGYPALYAEILTFFYTYIPTSATQTLSDPQKKILQTFAQVGDRMSASEFYRAFPGFLPPGYYARNQGFVDPLWLLARGPGFKGKTLQPIHELFYKGLLLPCALRMGELVAYEIALPHEFARRVTQDFWDQVDHERSRVIEELTKPVSPETLSSNEPFFFDHLRDFLIVLEHVQPVATLQHLPGKRDLKKMNKILGWSERYLYFMADYALHEKFIMSEDALPRAGSWPSRPEYPYSVAPQTASRLNAGLSPKKRLCSLWNFIIAPRRPYLWTYQIKMTGTGTPPTLGSENIGHWKHQVITWLGTHALDRPVSLQALQKLVPKDPSLSALMKEYREDVQPCLPLDGFEFLKCFLLELYFLGLLALDKPETNVETFWMTPRGRQAWALWTREGAEETVRAPEKQVTAENQKEPNPSATASVPAPSKLETPLQQVENPPSADRGATSDREEKIIVQPPYEIITSRNLNFEKLLTLARWCDITQCDVAYLFRLSKPRIISRMEEGDSFDSFIDFLKTHTGKDLPQPVQYLIQEVQQIDKRLMVETASGVVQTSKPEDLDELLKRYQFKDLFSTRISPTAVLLWPGLGGDLFPLVAALRKKGYFVQARVRASSRSSSPKGYQNFSDPLAPLTNGLLEKWPSKEVSEEE